METEFNKRLDAIEQKLEATYQSAEKTRKYLLWALILTVAAVVLPLIGLIAAIPSYLSTLNSIGTI